MSVCCECCVLSGRASSLGQSLAQRSPTECGVSEYDREVSVMRVLWPTGGCGPLGAVVPWGKNICVYFCLFKDISSS